MPRYAKYSVISVFNSIVYLKNRINAKFFEKKGKKNVLFDIAVKVFIRKLVNSLTVMVNIENQEER